MKVKVKDKRGRVLFSFVGINPTDEQLQAMLDAVDGKGGDSRGKVKYKGRNASAVRATPKRK